MRHIPVLLNEVIEYLDPKPNENFIDATLGEGGHTAAILERNGPEGKVLGIDLDPQQIENSKWLIEKFGQRIILINDSYVNLKGVVKREDFKPINGILLDLGMSSAQLEESGRGFSFLKDEPLDMRYDSENQKSKIKNQNELTAEKIVNEWSKDEIEKILKEYGEERFAKQIAKEVVKERRIKRIKSTFQLKEIIKKAVPLKFQHRKIRCATKTFQALRIAVNDELNNLKKVLPQALSVLSSEGRIVIISFHSLEDRIVKNFFRDKQKEGVIKILTKSPITTSEEEIKENPRSRSAKLRVAMKIKN
jgi:16S rRNA (cytosine1402-N4)-methyltransferase